MTIASMDRMKRTAIAPLTSSSAIVENAYPQKDCVTRKMTAKIQKTNITAVRMNALQYCTVIVRKAVHGIGDLHDGVTYYKYTRMLYPCCFVRKLAPIVLLAILMRKYKSELEIKFPKHSGSCSKTTSSCKSPVVNRT